MSPNRRLTIFTCLLLPLLLLTAASAQSLPRVSTVRVQDEAGHPLLARVTVSLQGRPTPDLYIFFTGPDGLCQLTGIPSGPADIEATHGPEWSIESTQAEVGAADGGMATITLRRLYDLPAHGYYQGDGHMHSTHSDGAQAPQEVAMHCRAEGLHWAVLTDHDNLDGHPAFMAQAVPAFLPMGGQEITTGKGHIVAWGVSQRVSNSIARGAEDMARIFREVHEQGGVAIVAHPMAPAMNYGFWDVEGYDALEILNGSLPPYGGLFDTLQARLKWHELLKRGKRIAVVGNSDNHDNFSSFARDALRDPQAAVKRQPLLGLLWNMPNRDTTLIPWGIKGLCLGSYRTCLKLPELSSQAVLEAMRAGRGFVTNGPILHATLNGLDPGSEVSGPSARLHFEVVCNRGLARLDVIAGGTQVHSVDLERCLTASGDLEVPLGDATWVTVECFGIWPEFATTNAWYVTR